MREENGYVIRCHDLFDGSTDFKGMKGIFSKTKDGLSAGDTYSFSGAKRALANMRRLCFEPAGSGMFVPAMKNDSGKLTKATTNDETTWAAYEQSDKTVGGKVDATAESKNISAENALAVKYTSDNGITVEDVSVYGDGLAVFD